MGLFSIHLVFFLPLGGPDSSARKFVWWGEWERWRERERERVKETEQEDILDALPVDVCGVLLVHYLGARSVAPWDFQGCDVVLKFFLGKRLCVAISILCRSKFPWENVLISFNLNYGSSLKKMFIILNHNHCSHIFLNEDVKDKNEI